METKRYNLKLTYAEAVALRDRLIPINPSEYSLQTFSILRDLYGRLYRWVFTQDFEAERKAKGD